MSTLIKGLTKYTSKISRLIYLPQASGPPLPLLALDHLLVPTSPSLPLTLTKQCSLEGDNHMAESMTATSWILSLWYVQKL